MEFSPSRRAHSHIAGPSFFATVFGPGSSLSAGVRVNAPARFASLAQGRTNLASRDTGGRNVVGRNNLPRSQARSHNQCADPARTPRARIFPGARAPLRIRNTIQDWRRQ